MTSDSGGHANARFGAGAQITSSRGLPSVFPREMGPHTMTYLQEVVDAGLASDMVSRFERVLADGHGRRHAVLTPGCNTALFALFAGLDFEPGDEIIVSAITDYGDLIGLLFENYIPVFADTEPGTGLISVRTIEPCITDRTRAIIVVNFFGLPCDYDPIMELAGRHGLLVIEDVCQSILARYKGRISGSLADISVFSFDSEKTLGGDVGGAVLMDDQQLYERIVNRAVSRGAVDFAGFGRKHLVQGLALRAPQCTAATCLGNWEILAGQVEKRQRTAAMLDEQLREVPGIAPYEVPPDRTHTYWMYGFSVDPARFTCSIDELSAELREAGIPCGMGRYYVLPASVPFLAEKVAAGAYPFGSPPASRSVDYDAARTTPESVRFMERWIRWSWTEKYSADHVELMASIIGEVCGKHAR
jgi:dTDP-4-amino-4,6-dideoxygalactose transaminase